MREEYLESLGLLMFKVSELGMKEVEGFIVFFVEPPRLQKF